MGAVTFEEACSRVLLRDADADISGGIGTLSERTLHKVLKEYYMTDGAQQEVPIGRFVADISSPSGIIEIQTRAFNNLRDKLEYFLTLGQVTVVHPIAQVKWLAWVDPTTGEVTKRRRSPKKGIIQHAFPELYRLKPIMPNDNLHFCFVMLELTEYRNLDGWSSDGKKGSSRKERIPARILDEIWLNDRASWVAAMLPSTLEGHFTSADYAREAHIPLYLAQSGIMVMCANGVLRRVGNRGRYYLYESVVDCSYIDDIITR